MTKTVNYYVFPARLGFYTRDVIGSVVATHRAAALDAALALGYDCGYGGGYRMVARGHLGRSKRWRELVVRPLEERPIG